MQEGFHLPQEVRCQFTDTPLLFEVRFQSVFFKMTPTVSWEIVSTTPNSTNWSASNLRDQWLCPSGGVLQAKAVTCARW